jgi:NAD-dependent SIR2 family protein deacetylase
MSKQTNREKLINTTRRGGITLVLGAGISFSAGIPSWEGLAKRMWEVAFGDEKSPWDAAVEKSPRSLPQFLPIIFEMALKQLKEEKFIEALHDCLYKNVSRTVKSPPRNPKSSLEVLARLICQEHGAGGRRRVIRVITFNVDDLLERTVSRYAGRAPKDKRASRSFARADRSRSWARGDEPIPIYHLHGFISRVRRSQLNRWVKNYDHMLVFTDSQYWESSSKMLSFANRIMGSALYDSHCVFTGLSMVDINLLRWLALRHNEMMAEYDEIFLRHSKNPVNGNDRPHGRTSFKPLTLKQHFWIRPGSDDPSGLLSKFLETRGVRSVPIRSWKGVSFKNLVTECFPPDEGACHA